MGFANSSNRLYHYVDFLECDGFDSEDDENYARLLRLATVDNTNCDNVRSCGPQKIVKDVGVQTVPVIDDTYIPWLLEAERKTEDFYVQLSNLVNTLYHSQSKVLKTKIRESPPSIIRNAPPEKSHHSNMNSKNFGYTKLPDGRKETPDYATVFQFIQDRIHSIRKSAYELKSSIPKAGLKKLDRTREQEYEVVKSKTVKETKILKLERSKSLVHNAGTLPPQHYKIKRLNTLSTITESKFVDKRRIHGVSKPPDHGAGKSGNIYSVPKTKNTGNTKNTAAGACNTKEKQTSPQDTNVPTKDTGAIPKTREGRGVTSANPTNRTQKAKKPSAKPMWR